MGQHRIVVRRLLLVILAAGLAAGVAVPWAIHRQGEHLASAVIMLHPSEGNAYSPGGRGDDLVNLETEAQVLRSDAVAQLAVAKLGENVEPSALLSAISVSVPPNTQLLEITARGATDAIAETRASTFAEVYLAFRRTRTEATIQDRATRIDDLVRQRERERDDALSRLDRLGPNSPRRTLIEQQVQEIVVQISSLRTELAAAQAVSLDPGQIIDPGHVEGRGLLADPLHAGLAAGGVGLLLGLVVMMARTFGSTPDVIRGIDDLAAVADLEDHLLLGAARGTVESADETIARVRSELLAAGTGPPAVVTVAGAGRDDARILAALADSLAQARFEVIVVDLAEEEAIVALTELVLDKVDVPDVLVADGECRSRIEPKRPGAAGRDGSDFSNLAASARMRRNLAELAKHGDVVLVGCPGFDTPVGRAMLAASTAIVIELVPRRCTPEQFDRLFGLARRSGVDVIGVVEVAP